MHLHMHDPISYPHPHSGRYTQCTVHTERNGGALYRLYCRSNTLTYDIHVSVSPTNGYESAQCVITRHYPPIKSLSNNYLTVRSRCSGYPESRLVTVTPSELGLVAIIKGFLAKFTSSISPLIYHNDS